MKLLRNASLYLLFDIANKAIPFILLPILTVYLAPENYGSLSLFSAFLAFMSPFIHLVLHTNLQRTYFKQSKEETAKLIFNLQLTATAASLVVFLILLLFKDYFTQQFSISLTLLAVMPFILLININIDYLLIILRNQEKIVQFGIFQIVYTCINFGVSLFLVISIGLDWYGRMYGILSGMTVMGLVSFGYLLKQGFIKISFNWPLIKKCLAISLPVIPNGLASNVINLSDRFFVEELLGKDVLGIYSVGYSLGMIMFFLAVAVNQAVNPWIYKQLQTSSETSMRDMKYRLASFTWIFSIGMLIAALLITIACRLIISWGFLPPNYALSQQYILWVALSYVCYGINLVLFPYLVNAEKTNYYFPLSVSAALVNLIGNYYLIQYYGALGATYATLLAYIILMIGAFVYVQRVFPMPWFHRQTWNHSYSIIYRIFKKI